TKDRGAHGDIRGPSSETRPDVAAPIAGADDSSADAHHQTAAQPFGYGFEHRALEATHRLDGPVGRVLAGACGDRSIDVTRGPLVVVVFVFPSFFTEKAQDSIERSQADGAVAQAFRMQPVLIETQSIRQNVGDALEQAGDKNAAHPGLTHGPGAG